MLEWNEATSRYSLHDLMRTFARGRLSSAESGEAALQHARHYRDVIRSANELYLKGGESLMRALALFDLEWANIQAGQAWAVTSVAKDYDASDLSSDYPDSATPFLLLRQHPREHIRWREAALVGARQCKNRAAEGRHLGSLGYSYDDLGEYGSAIECYEQRLAIAREIGDRNGEGRTL